MIMRQNEVLAKPPLQSVLIGRDLPKGVSPQVKIIFGRSLKGEGSGAGDFEVGEHVGTNRVTV